MKKQKILLAFLLICAGLVMAACDTLLASFSTTDSQSATLTAMVTPTSPPPTLDLKGNEVLDDVELNVYEVVAVSLLEDRLLNLGIIEWGAVALLFAYVAPVNRYWGWFSGDAVVLNFDEKAKVPDEDGVIPAGLAPSEYSTTDVNAFGDFAFSADHTYIAFVALRQSEKLYTVMVSRLDSELKDVTDLFPGSAAETDEYASDKSILGWDDEENLRVSSSCGVDCERIYTVNVRSAIAQVVEETRKYAHDGRKQDAHVIEYDDRDYPAMNMPNWSPDEMYVFYTDNRGDAWILKEGIHQQYKLPVDGSDVLQSLWSFDSRFIALRFEDAIKIFEVK